MTTARVVVVAMSPRQTATTSRHSNATIFYNTRLYLVVVIVTLSVVHIDTLTNVSIGLIIVVAERHSLLLVLQIIITNKLPRNTTVLVLYWQSGTVVVYKLCWTLLTKQINLWLLPATEQNTQRIVHKLLITENFTILQAPNT